MKKILPYLFLILPVMVLTIFGCANQAGAGDDIPIQGAVYSVHRSDGSQKTYFEVIVGPGFSGKLPDDIDSIIVSGPHGDLPSGKKDFEYNHQWRSFLLVRPGVPETGTYIFKVTSGEKKGLATDVQSVVKTIPLPDTSKFVPGTKETVTCRSPLFSWPALDEEEPLYYQLDVRDINRKHVYKSLYLRDMTSFRLPPDVLETEKQYQWRVRVLDGPDWLAVNNRSQSDWVSFTTRETENGCAYRYRIPTEADGDWPTSSLEAQDVDRQKIEELMNLILDNKLKNIHGLLLIKNGKLVLEEYFSGYNRNTLHILMSVTKSVTSILFGIARDRGYKVDLNATLVAYLPDYKDLLADNEKSEITLEDMLTMRAGLAWNEWKDLGCEKGMYVSSDPIEYVLGKKMVDPPGEHFFYSSGVSTVLGRILENTTGMKVDQFAEEYLFAPLGITEYKWRKHADGTVLTAGHLFLRPRDMAKLGYLFLKEGVWQGREIVPKSWVLESTSPHVRGDLVSGTGYGYQWWRGSTRIGDREIDSYYAVGHGGQFIFVIPEVDTIVVFTSQADDNDAGDFRAYSAMENYILPALFHLTPTIEAPPSKVENVDRITGKYVWSKAKLKLKIFEDQGKLYGETILFEDKFQLIPYDDRRFMCVSDDIGKFRLEKQVNAKGKITGVKLVIGFSNISFKKTGWSFWPFGRD